MMFWWSLSRAPYRSCSSSLPSSPRFYSLPSGTHYIQVSIRESVAIQNFQPQEPIDGGLSGFVQARNDDGKQHRYCLVNHESQRSSTGQGWLCSKGGDRARRRMKPKARQGQARSRRDWGSQLQKAGKVKSIAGGPTRASLALQNSHAPFCTLEPPPVPYTIKKSQAIFEIPQPNTIV